MSSKEQVYPLHHPSYSHSIGNITLRWSTPSYADAITACVANAFRYEPTGPPHVFLGTAVDGVLKNPKCAWMTPYDCAIAVDEKNGKVVSCVSIWKHDMSYGGVKYQASRPELVATDPEYRGKGLIKMLFAMIHARSKERGVNEDTLNYVSEKKDFAQILFGIPGFYTQLGYTWAFKASTHGGRITKLADIPAIPADTSEVEKPISIRLPRPNEYSTLWSFYHSWRPLNVNWPEPPEGVIEASATYPRAWSKYFAIVNGADEPIGMLITPGSFRTTDPFRLTPFFPRGSNALAITPSFLRAVAQFVSDFPVENPSVPPVESLHWDISTNHPIWPYLEKYTTWGDSAYDLHTYLVRVPDIPRFLSHISSVLHSRLSNSVFSDFTGALRINLYRTGLTLNFKTGNITIEPWDSTHIFFTSRPVDVHFPENAFLRLVFGDKNVDELDDFIPDVRIKSSWARELLKVLFPEGKSNFFMFT